MQCLYRFRSRRPASPQPLQSIGYVANELELRLLDTWPSADRKISQEDFARCSPVADCDLQPHIAQRVPMFVNQTVPHWRRLGALR